MLPMTENKTIVISIAGRTLEEIEQRVKLFDGYNVYILHCVAEYPCNVSHLRLGNISRLRKELDIKWFTTIQDIPSMYEMLEFDLPMYKIASCNGNNKEFLNAVHSNIDKNHPSLCHPLPKS